MTRDYKQEFDDFYHPVGEISYLYYHWAKEFGIRHYTFLLYYRLLMEGSFTQGYISDELQIPRQTINSIVKKLGEEGMIRLEASPTSKKEKVLVLTESGQAYAQEMVLPFFEIERRAMAQFPPEEIQQTIATMQRLSDYMTAEVQHYLQDKK